MHIAAPWLLVAGGYILGLLFHAFRFHKGLGVIALVIGLALIGAGLSGYSLTVPRGVTVNHPSPSATPVPHHS